MSPLRAHPPHLVDSTNTQYLGGQHWQQSWFFFFFFYFVSICFSIGQSVCLYICLQLISNFWKFTTIDRLVYICEPGFRARIKKVKTAYVLECLRILPKNEGEALVSGFGSEQPLQQQLAPACFVAPVCSMVVLWNICFLSVQSSFVVPAWLWTTTLQYNYSTLDNISKCFNI